jgi:GNAT superfamily N-acetyltransferase
MTWAPRLATAADIPALAALIPLSVRGLQTQYSPAQREAALGDVFGVDTQLIGDGTLFVVEAEGRIVAGGGWSRRPTLFGGDARRAGDQGVLDPRSDPARIRAFFVHPQWARRGLGRALLVASEAAIQAAGFRRVTLTSTLAGEPFYAALGYRVRERFDLAMANGQPLPAVAMEKDLSGGPVQAAEQEGAQPQQQ